MTIRSFLLHLLIFRVSQAQPTKFSSSLYHNYIAQLNLLEYQDWFKQSPPTNYSAVTLWRAALSSCYHCSIDEGQQDAVQGSLLTELIRFRSLPDRQYYWHTLLPALVKIKILPKLLSADTDIDDQPVVPVIRVLSIGYQFYNVEDEFHLRHYLLDQGATIEQLKRIEYHTMDKLQSTHDLLQPASVYKSTMGMPNQHHCTGDATLLPSACQNRAIATSSMDIILINGVIGWGVSDSESVSKLIQALSNTLKTDGILVTGRNVPRLCCSNIPFIQKGFVPIVLDGLPTRRTFPQPLEIGGGHVYDTFQKKISKEKEIVDTLKKVNFQLTYAIDGVVNIIHVTVPLLDTLPTEPAEVVCDSFSLFMPSTHCIAYVIPIVARYLEIARAEATRSRCARRRLMLVAHPDDELLFGGSTLLSSDSVCWTIVVATNQHNKIRAAEFQRSMSLIGAEGYMLSFVDGPFSVPFSTSQGTINDWIVFFISLTKWDRIVTHGPLGEYGHSQHIEMHQQVKIVLEAKRTQEPTAFVPPLWVFQIVGWDTGNKQPHQTQVMKELKGTANEVYKSQGVMIDLFLNAIINVVPIEEFAYDAVGCKLDNFPSGMKVFSWICQSHLAMYREGMRCGSKKKQDC